MEENKNVLQGIDLKGIDLTPFAKIAEEVIQDQLDPKFMGLRSSTWKKIGWGAAAVGAVAVVGYGAYKFFGEDGGTVSDGTSGAPCF